MRIAGWGGGGVPGGGKMAVEALRAHIQAFSSLGPSALKDYEARLRQLVRDVAPEPEPEAEPEQGSREQGSREQGSGDGPDGLPPEVAAQLSAAQRLLSVLAGMAAAHEGEDEDEDEDEERVYVPIGSDSYTRGKEEGWREAAMGPRVLHFDLVSPLRGGLWADRIWPSATVLATDLDAHPGLVEGRSVLEIGAGAALPSVVAALRGGAGAGGERLP
eukprot:COSAG04_NODE_917_length_9428_cov_3.927109_13_plen_217_part_00